MLVAVSVAIQKLLDFTLLLLFWGGGVPLPRKILLFHMQTVNSGAWLAYILKGLDAEDYLGSGEGVSPPQWGGVCRGAESVPRKI